MASKNRRDEGQTPDTGRRGETLMGERGKVVALNLARLAAGMVSAEELGDSYYVADDGAIGLVVDDETFDLLTNVPSSDRRP